MGINGTRHYNHQRHTRKIVIRVVTKTDADSGYEASRSSSCRWRARRDAQQSASRKVGCTTRTTAM